MSIKDFYALDALHDVLSIEATQCPHHHDRVVVQISSAGCFATISLAEHNAKALRNWLTKWIAREGPDA